MAVAKQVFISLDCTEPAPLAEFWAAMLGGEVMFTTASAMGVRTDGAWLVAMHIPDYRPPTWPGGDIPKQMHLDLGVTDVDAAVAEAERLGARLAPEQPAPERWRVLLARDARPARRSGGSPDR